MPKKISKEDEQKFIDYYLEGETAGNATQSAKKAGWTSNPTQMGSYLKKKYAHEIREKNEDRITSTSGLAITVLQDLLRSEQDAVRLNTAKLVLEMGGFSSQNINLNVDKAQSKTDAELIEELQGLVSKIPALKPKLAMIQDNTEEESGDTPEKDSTMDENRLTH
jgi:phage terminase small subunit